MTPKQPLVGIKCRLEKLFHQLLESQDGNTLIQEGLLHHGSWDTPVAANHCVLQLVLLKQLKGFEQVQQAKL